MSNVDDLYNQLNKSNEARKRNNFNIFMTGLYNGLERDLDRDYIQYGVDGSKYIERLNSLKSKGFKVMRNSKGKHKVEVIV